MTATQTVQMNTRIPLQLKQQGDEVLARAGKTASEVMRAVWQYMADTQQIPACAQRTNATDADLFELKLQTIEEGSSLVSRFYAEQGLTQKPLVPYEQLQDEMHDSLLAEYEALPSGGADA